MLLDPVTLHVANGLTNVTYAIMFLALSFGGRRRGHFRAWSAAHFFIAAGVLGFSFLGRTDAVASAAMIGLISLGIAWIWVGCRRFDGVAAPIRVLPLAFLAPLGFLLGAFALGDPRVGQAMTVASLAILSSGIGLQLLRGERVRSFPRFSGAFTSLAFLPAYLLSALASFAVLPLPVEGTVVLLADQILTNILAVALLAMTGERRQRRLADLALVDPLTGVLNRAGLEAFALGAGAGRAVLLADLDHFKAINDRHGHPAGDEVLRRFAAQARRIMRPGDAIARLGGEEFVVVLASCGRGEAEGMAEILRSLVEAGPLDWNGVPIQATVSIGVAEVATGETLARAIERADHALYLAKTAGRNRVSA